MVSIVAITINSSGATWRWPDCSDELAPTTTRQCECTPPWCGHPKVARLLCELAPMTQGSAVHAALMLIVTIIIINSNRATRRWPDCSGELAPMTQGSAGAHSLDVYCTIIIIINSCRGTQRWPDYSDCSDELAPTRQGSAGAHHLGAGTQRLPDCSGELAPMTQGSAGAHSLDVYYCCYH